MSSGYRVVWQLGHNVPEEDEALPSTPALAGKSVWPWFVRGRNQAELQPAPAFPAAIFIPWMSTLGKWENHNLALNLLQASHFRDSASVNCKVLKEVGIKTRNKEDVDMFYYWI